MSEPTSAELPTTPRSRLRRKRERGSHDRDVIDAILDEGLVAHVGFVGDGSVFVIPMAYARVDDHLYFHGAAANRTLIMLADGAEACVTVTLLDALVLARSAFHHSMNYRCVTLFGQGEKVVDERDKRDAVMAIVEHLVPGRGGDTRHPSEQEMRSTLVVRFPIMDGSAKVRSGGPIDDEQDLALRVWAGLLPFELHPLAPIPDDQLPHDIPVPEYVTGYATRH